MMGGFGERYLVLHPSRLQTQLAQFLFEPISYVDPTCNQRYNTIVYFHSRMCPPVNIQKDVEHPPVADHFPGDMPWVSHIYGSFP